MTFRKVAAIVRWLPRSSALVRAEHDGMEPWGALELIADEHRRDYMQAHAKGHVRPSPMVGSPLGPKPSDVAAEADARERGFAAAEARDAARIERLRRQGRKEGT